MTATPRSIFVRSESPTRTALIATRPVTNGSSIFPIYERLFFHNDLSSDRHICGVSDHSRLGSYLHCFGLELSHQELNRFKYEKSALPQRFSKFLQLVNGGREACQHPSSCQGFPCWAHHLPRITEIDDSSVCIQLQESLRWVDVSKSDLT